MATMMEVQQLNAVRTEGIRRGLRELASLNKGVFLRDAGLNRVNVCSGTNKIQV
nr:Uncharacterised protein [Salmonella sp. NCTC 7297]